MWLQGWANEGDVGETSTELSEPFSNLITNSAKKELILLKLFFQGKSKSFRKHYFFNNEKSREKSIRSLTFPSSRIVCEHNTRNEMSVFITLRKYGG